MVDSVAMSCSVRIGCTTYEQDVQQTIDRHNIW